MNYNYTEEHYAEMYNNLPEGLKDLVISGRLAIQVAAIGTRHGLNSDQVADLEPAVEDLCLGLILKDQLAENIRSQVGIDDRVSNRIAAEVEIEILRPFEPELIIARQQKEDLDKKISASKNTNKVPVNNNVKTEKKLQEEFEPKNVSEHSNVTAVKNFYTAGTETNTKPAVAGNQSFDWENFGKKAVVEETVPHQEEEKVTTQTTATGVEAKLDKLTDSINQLVNSRFGADKSEVGVSEEMKKILERLERAEKENEENKKLIKKLQGNNTPNSLTNIFTENKSDSQLNKVSVGENSTENKIKIDKPRNVDISKNVNTDKVANTNTDNVQVKAISNNIPIQITPSVKPEIHMYSSSVTQGTADTIVETRNKEVGQVPLASSNKSVLSLDELISKGDSKIKEAAKTTGQLVFPSISAEKNIDIKNIAQADSLRQTLLDDLEFIKRKNGTEIANPTQNVVVQEQKPNNTAVIDTNTQTTDLQDLVSNNTSSVTLNQFKDEIIPKTKEDRMKALQDKIKAMNKGVSAGGANSIAATALDPYKL